jgi:membrane protease YdiL (CAAX protease family)
MTNGIDNFSNSLFTAVPTFIPMLLTFIYLVIFLGGISRQKARTGTSDYAMWSTIAGISTFMTALLMTLGNGIINLTYLVITLVVTIASSAWLFFDRKQSEI